MSTHHNSPGAGFASGFANLLGGNFAVFRFVSRKKIVESFHSCLMSYLPPQRGIHPCTEISRSTLSHCRATSFQKLGLYGCG
jgi:hypothetical protein